MIYKIDDKIKQDLECLISGFDGSLSKARAHLILGNEFLSKEFVAKYLSEEFNGSYRPAGFDDAFSRLESRIKILSDFDMSTDYFYLFSQYLQNYFNLVDKTSYDESKKIEMMEGVLKKSKLSDSKIDLVLRPLYTKVSSRRDSQSFLRLVNLSRRIDPTIPILAKKVVESTLFTWSDFDPRNDDSVYFKNLESSLSLIKKFDLGDSLMKKLATVYCHSFYANPSQASENLFYNLLPLAEKKSIEDKDSFLEDLSGFISYYGKRPALKYFLDIYDIDYIVLLSEVKDTSLEIDTLSTLLGEKIPKNPDLIKLQLQNLSQTQIEKYFSQGKIWPALHLDSSVGGSGFDFSKPEIQERLVNFAMKLLVSTEYNDISREVIPKLSDDNIKKVSTTYSRRLAFYSNFTSISWLTHALEFAVLADSPMRFSYGIKKGLQQLLIHEKDYYKAGELVDSVEKLVKGTKFYSLLNDVPEYTFVRSVWDKSSNKF